MKKITKLIIPLMLFTLTLTGCGASSKDTMYQESFDTTINSSTAGSNSNQDFNISYDSSMESTKGEISNNSQFETMPESSIDNSIDTSNTTIDGAKLIRNIDLYLATTEFDSLVKSIKEKVNTYNGYIQSSDLRTYSTRYQDIVVRIPYKNVDLFLSGIEEFSTIESISDETIDITLQYADITTRIENLEQQHTRLLELLETATDLSYIIQLEERLTEVETELDSFKLEIKNYDNLVNYSTIRIHIDETKYISPVEDETIFGRIKSGLSNNLYEIKENAIDLFVYIIVNIPNIIISIIYLVILIFIFKIIRKYIRKIRIKKENFIKNNLDEATKNKKE